MDNNGLSFGCAMENTGITVTGEAPLMADTNKREVLEHNISIDQPVVAPHQRKFWTKEERKLVDTYILPCHVVLVVLYLKSTYDN